MEKLLETFILPIDIAMPKTHGLKFWILLYILVNHCYQLGI